ncbi:MAG TPA: hypothetical protein PKW79_00230 [Rhabdochlamydiaceae bacterium]|nr:hypothetical protein [Rhabdochlamydiaceae bacterium]
MGSKSGVESFQEGFRKATKYSNDQEDKLREQNDMSVREKASAMLMDMQDGAMSAAEMLGYKKKKSEDK